MTNVSCPQSGLRTIRDCAKPKNSNFPDFFCGFVRCNVCNYKKKFHKNPLRNVGEVAKHSIYGHTQTTFLHSMEKSRLFSHIMSK